MKKLINSAFFILFLSLVVSCSSDDSNEAVNQNPPADTFTLKIDGQEKTFIEFTAEKSNHALLVYGETTDGYSVELVFNKQGHLGHASLIRQEPLNYKRSLEYNTDANFNFALEGFNEANHGVSANFSGKVYGMHLDEQDEFSEIEGSFDLSYIDVEPETPELWLTATFNGQNWIDAGSNSMAYGWVGNSTDIKYKNGSEYSISVYVDNEMEMGTYLFNEASTDRKVIVHKYNPELGNEVDFEGDGTLIITEKEVLENGTTIFKGDFSLMAEHPETGEAIVVWNGSFKGASFY